MLIRQYNPEDCSKLTDLFYQTVHTVNAKDYTEEQLDAWADGNIYLNEWNKSFLEHYSLVAEIDKVIVGFGDIDRTGYLDRLFVHKDYQHQGIASAICDELENVAIDREITTHSSITAKGFFEKRGYKVVKEQQVVRNEIKLTNYIMKKWKI